MQIQEFHAALENTDGNVAFLHSLRMMATSHAEQAAQTFAEGAFDEIDVIWTWAGSGGAEGAR
jgi:hypothetical protein